MVEILPKTIRGTALLKLDLLSEYRYIFNSGNSNDPVFDDIDCFHITRSSGTLINQDGKSTREQLNQLTGTITGGAVYGFSKPHLEALRKPNSGNLVKKLNFHMRFYVYFSIFNHYYLALLRIADMGTRGEYLPITTQIPSNFRDITDGFQVPDVFNDHKHPPFFAGDGRVMENTILSTWHTMFVRLHNVFVEELESILPGPEFKIIKP